MTVALYLECFFQTLRKGRFLRTLSSAFRQMKLVKEQSMVSKYVFEFQILTNNFKSVRHKNLNYFYDDKAFSIHIPKVFG